MTDPTLPIKNTALLRESLTHRSYLNEHQEVKQHNERLEFLGDAVLELIVSEFLFKKFSKQPEGELTAYRAALVKTQSLAEVAATLKLGDKLNLSKGEAVSGGRKNQSLLANTFEAVVGAIFLDQGLEVARDFITTHLLPKIDGIIEQKLFKDFKSSLQEYVQSQGSEAPEYQVVEESGPDHDKHFTIAVVVDGHTIGTGKGKNKQTAQQEAARTALEKLQRA